MAADLDRYRRAETRLWENVGAAPIERRVTLASGGAVRVQELGSGDPLLFMLSLQSCSQCGPER